MFTLYMIHCDYFCNSPLNKTVRLIENRIPMWSFKLGHPKLFGFLHEKKTILANSHQVVLFIFMQKSNYLTINSTGLTTLNLRPLTQSLNFRA